MALDLSSGSIIRAGSGILYVLLGAALLARRSPTRASRTLGAFALLFGSGFILVNLIINADPPDPALLGPATLVVVGTRLAFAGVGVALALTVPPARREERAAFTTIGAGFLVAIAFDALVWTPEGVVAFDAKLAIPTRLLLADAYGSLALIWLIVALPLLCAWRYALSSDDPTRSILVRVGLAAAFYAAAASASDATGEIGTTGSFTSPSSARLGLAIVLVSSATWLWAHARAPSRGALLAAVAPLAFGLVALAADVWLGPARADQVGFIGIARILGWLALLQLVLGHPDVGLKLPGLKPNRSAVTLGSLALLFVVAQVAESFFAAKYGLIFGGVAAGAFLFAASPIQRAIERGTAPWQDAPAASLSASDANERAFRDAVRLAWKDRRFDRQEEIALANLADRLGLSARRATEIRHDVEEEKGVAR